MYFLIRSAKICSQAPAAHQSINQLIVGSPTRGTASNMLAAHHSDLP
jgi:hypothetical protein